MRRIICTFCLLFGLFGVSLAAEWFPAFGTVRSGSGLDWGLDQNNPSDSSSLFNFAGYAWEQLIDQNASGVPVAFKWAGFDVLGDVDAANLYSILNVPSHPKSNLSLMSDQTEELALDAVSLPVENDETFAVSGSGPSAEAALISVIPEPVTVGLLGSGGLILMLAKRLRRRS